MFRRIYRADLVQLLLQSQPAGSVWFCLVPGECSKVVSAVEHAVTEVRKVFVLFQSPLVSRGGSQVTVQRRENIRLTHAETETQLQQHEEYKDKEYKI